MALIQLLSSPACPQ